MKYNSQTFLQIMVAIGFAAQLTSCGSKFETPQTQLVTDEAITKIPNDTPTSALPPGLHFCSPLSFEGIAWSPALNLTARRSLAIALSISGSFEGSDGWANISNDFDGMGLSAGLLNQTLGTSSLQPLLAEMEHSYPAEFAASFSPAHYKSILSMIETWKKATSWRPKNLGLTLNNISDRDAESIEIATTPADYSVLWARKNLYNSDGSFIPSWKKEIQNLLTRPEYISLQIEAARQYHKQALQYVDRVEISDLRTYLLMFDIVTQNGSIKESRFIEWEYKVRTARLTSTESKLKALIDIRLKDTKSQWRNDVKRRKYTIIDGVGIVHGKNLNLPRMYCFDNLDSIF